MAPVRRYLRISKYSVLECRIYLDNPSLAQSWLLNPRDPILPKVIESIRPLVLPKLREENERARKKSSKKKGIKDVIVQDGFEVSMFLTETSTRHSLLTKQKHFREKAPPPLQSNSTRLISETNDQPVDVDAEDAIAVIREDSDDEPVRLSDIPLAQEPRTSTRSKRNRSAADLDAGFGESDDDASPIEVGSDTDEPVTKRPRAFTGLDEDPEETDDKKKLAMDVRYEGFAIYGRVLCLVVRRRETKPQQSANGNQPEGQASMENWITSTQIPVGQDIP